MTLKHLVAIPILVSIIGVAQRQPTVVNNPAPDFRAPAFFLGQRPAIVIDANVSGDTLSELYNLTDATLTPTGSLIAINNYGATIREFDSRGTFVRNISRKGAGPGEFRSISSLRALAGDTLVFYDANQRRITMLGPDRRHVRTISNLRNPVCCSMTGHFADRDEAPAGFGGRSWSPGRLNHYFGDLRSLGGGGFAFAPDSAKAVSLPGYSGAFTLTEERAGGSPIWTTYAVPFTIAPVARFGVDELITGTGERFEYQMLRGNGTLVRTVRAAAPLRPVTRDMISAYRANFTSKNPGLVRQRLAMLDTLKLPATLPAYDRLHVEEDGTVWVRDYLVSDSLPRGWARFDRQGRLLGTMIVPANLTLFRFSHGHAIVAVRDTTRDFQRLMAVPVVRK